MRTISGVIGTAQLSWTIKSAGEDYIRIYGTQGTLCIGWKNSMYRLNGMVDWIQFGEGYSTLKAVTRQMENMVDAVAGDALPETSAEEGLQSVKAIEAAYQSLASGQWINLNPDSLVKVTSNVERNFTVLRPGRISTSNA